MLCSAALLVALAACGRVDIDSLPAIPDVVIADAAPGVQAQLEEALQRARHKPADAAVNGRLAMILQAYKQFSGADIMYRRVRALDSDEFDWPYLHGIVLSALGRPDEAIEAFRDALRIDDDYPLAHVHLAELLADRGDTRAANEHYDRAFAAESPPSEAYFSHGRFLLQQGRVDPAIRRFQETLRLSGDFSAVHYQLGMAYRNKQDEALAERHLMLARYHEGASADSTDPILNQLLMLNRSEQPFVSRAKRLAESGRMEEAQRYIALALERNPDSVAAHTSMIGMATARRDFVKVNEHFEKAIALEPDNAKIYFNLGIARIAEQRYEDAQVAFERSLELDPADANTHVQIAILDHRAGRTDSAKQHLRAALAIDPQNQFGNWLLGELLTARGQAEEALPYLNRSVQMPHGLAPMMYIALAQARAATDDWDGAFSALDAAHEAAVAGRARNLQQRVAAVRIELTGLQAREESIESD